MTDSDDTRSKEQLLAEIEALKEQLTAQGTAVNSPTSGKSSEPIFSSPMTRREALVGWIAPVVLSMSVVTAAVKPVTAYAATRVPTRAAPTRTPTMAGTTAPTAVPIPALGVVGLAALGGALAVTGAKLLKNRTDSEVDGPNSGGGSGSDRGSL